MRNCTSILCFFIVSCLANAQQSELERNYVQAWKAFYPSKALKKGMRDAVFSYEDFSQTSIEEWLKLQHKTLPQCDELVQSKDVNARINGQHLVNQIKSEILTWEVEQPHLNQLTLYTDLIESALLFDFDFLTEADLAQATQNRANAATRLCQAALQIEGGSKGDLEKGLESLQKSLSFCRERVAEGKVIFQKTQEGLSELISHGKRNLLPKAEKASGVLGRAKYARQLAVYTADDLTPEKLADLAQEEISEVKRLMTAVARRHLHLGQVGGNQFDSGVVRQALADMEADVTQSSEEYTSFWRGLADSLVLFLQAHDLATVPKHLNLSIIPAPESAGPMARIGWVASSPPFDPNPWTTLYVPSVPDTLDELEKKEFWASFNKPFNRFIAIHELFPGHYLQIKMARETPHIVRLLFQYGPYIEGWATFCEEIVLDAGWDADKPLTRLAHLRKRLENANRALMSVRVHCDGWNREQVMDHSTDVALLAPQFARSLWGRLIRGPMQMTSYFYGGRQFRELYKAERARQGEDFILRDFVDTILKAGPIPTMSFASLMQVR